MQPGELQAKCSPHYYNAFKTKILGRRWGGARWGGAPRRDFSNIYFDSYSSMSKTNISTFGHLIHSSGQRTC